jgi:dihydroorotate dehydrogenase (NAD+) catalytic subunit
MKKISLKVQIGKLHLENPVMVASGTFGYAEEFKDFVDLKKLGAMVTKTITLRPREGNPVPRTCETPSGMLNSIGLENPGIDRFIAQRLPILKKIGIPIIVSISSIDDPQEFLILARQLDKIKAVSAIELNISCPNIKGTGHRAQGTGLIAQGAKATYELVKAVRQVTQKTLITKLSPNVTDINEIALAAEQAGTDAVALVNTFLAMAIDIEKKRPRIAMVTAGLSGPAIRPIAVRMVWEVYNKIKIPIIGMGGIMDTQDALEFIIAGATAVNIGTANFINPKATVEIIKGIEGYFSERKINNINSLKGSLNL